MFLVPKNAEELRRLYESDVPVLAFAFKRRAVEDWAPEHSHLRGHPDCGLPFVLVGRNDDTCRRYVIPNQLHVHWVRDAAEELFAFSKNYRTGEQ
jgi:hypothetical protein